VNAGATDRRPSAFWPSLWLGLTLFAAKGAHWGLPHPPDYPVTHWLRDWLVSAHQDVLFAAGFGLLAQALLLAVGRWRRGHTIVFALIVGSGAFCAAYAVVAHEVFGFLRSPLTYPLLYLAGGMADMRSSMEDVGGLAGIAALVWVPLTYLALVLFTRRRRLTSPGKVRRALRAAVAVLLVGYVVVAHQTAAGRWSDRADVLIARSPHWAFLESLVHLAAGRGAPSIDVAFGAEELTDFQPPAATSRPRPPLAPGVEPPRNVLVLILESNAARYTSLYGDRYDTTPSLAREARHGVVFDAHYTPVGLTANVMVAMHLSVFPYMTWREYTVEYPDYPGVTLAQRLHARGYRTMFIHTGHLKYTNQAGFLERRGYDAVVDWDSLDAGPEVSSWGGDDRLLIERLLAWIDEDPGRPFLGVAWTINSHHPYEPVPGQEIIDFFQGDLPPDAYDLGRYLNTVRETDRQVGRLFDGLRARGLADSTLVIVVGDHGQAFGWPHPTWGHGFRVYDENVRVPLLVWNPRLFPEGRHSAAITSHLDVNPTVAQVLGLSPDPAWQGRSVFDPGHPPRAYFYAANDAYLLGVREESWKYIYNATRGSEELYDLAADPDELMNVARDHPDRCRRLRRRLAAWKQDTAERLARAVER